MSDRFRIHKIAPRGVHVPWGWRLDYPDSFSDVLDGWLFARFEQAVAAFIDRQDEQCPMCLRGAVEDRPWGWECTACGASDVAKGCVRP